MKNLTLAAYKKNPLAAIQAAVGSDYEVTHDQERYPPNNCLDLYTITKKGITNVQVILQVYKGLLNEASGTTRYLYNNLWYSFDRIGVENSFYYNTKKVLLEVVEAQFERVKKRIEEREILQATGVTINFGPTSRQYTKEAAEEVYKSLRSGNSLSLYPSGFGTGYIFTIKRSRYFQIASQEISEKVGKPVYYTTFDAD